MTYDDIVDLCCHARNDLVARPWLIMSIGIRDWAAVGKVITRPHEIPVIIAIRKGSVRTHTSLLNVRHDLVYGRRGGFMSPVG
jgi:hypothetical protein